MTAIELDIEQDRLARLRLADWELKGVKGRLKGNRWTDSTQRRLPSETVLAIFAGKKFYRKAAKGN